MRDEPALVGRRNGVLYQTGGGFATIASPTAALSHPSRSRARPTGRSSGAHGSAGLGAHGWTTRSSRSSTGSGSVPLDVDLAGALRSSAIRCSELQRRTPIDGVPAPEHPTVVFGRDRDRVRRANSYGASTKLRSSGLPTTADPTTRSASEARTPSWSRTAGTKVHRLPDATRHPAAAGDLVPRSISTPSRSVAN